MRDVELEKLEVQAQEVLDKLKELELEKMLEEIQCFKEILSLQKRLLKANSSPDSTADNRQPSQNV